MHLPSRIAWLLPAAAAALALAGCGEKAAAPPAPGAAPALTKVVLQTDWYAQPEHGGFYQALVKGYYREAGLDVTIAQGGPNSIPTQKVMLGAAQFAIGRSDDLMIAAGRGIPVQIVGALMQRDPQAIMFHKESGIRDFKDLDGRNVMAVPGAAWITITEKKYGIKLAITPLDFGLSRFLADKKFVQQCFITSEPYYVGQQGAEIGLLLLSETGFSPYRAWYTSRDFAKKNPAVVRAFTAASIRGWRDYMEGDRAEADARIGALNPKMLPAFIDYCVAAMKQHKLVFGDPAKGEALGRIDPVRLAGELKQLGDIGMIGEPVKLPEFFDPQFIAAATPANPAAK